MSFLSRGVARRPVVLLASSAPFNPHSAAWHPDNGHPAGRSIRGHLPAGSRRHIGAILLRCVAA